MVFSLSCIQLETDALDLAGERTLLTRLLLDVLEGFLVKYALESAF